VVAARSASRAVDPRTKTSLKPGISVGCSTDDEVAGYQIVVTKAWVFAPRQLYAALGTKLREAMPTLKKGAETSCPVFVVQYELASVGERQAVIALGKSRFRSGTRGFIRACHSSLAVTKGPKRNLWASHWKGWLSDTELTKVNKLFLEILGVFRNERTARVGRTPHELTFALAPVLSRFDKDKSRQS
jgi:hypothetical protein